MQMWRKIPSCWIQWNFTRNIRETKWWWSTLVQRFKYLYPLFQYTVLEKNRIVSFTVFTRKVRFLLKFYLWFLKGWTCHQFLKWSQVHFRLSLRRLCPLNCSWSGWFSRLYWSFNIQPYVRPFYLKLSLWFILWPYCSSRALPHVRKVKARNDYDAQIDHQTLGIDVFEIYI